MRSALHYNTCYYSRGTVSVTLNYSSPPPSSRGANASLARQCDDGDPANQICRFSDHKTENHGEKGAGLLRAARNDVGYRLPVQ